MNTKPILYLTLGWFGIQMAMALDTTQFQVMLDAYVHNAFLIGSILSLGPIAGIIVQPAIGWYGDVLARQGISREILMKLGVGVGLLSTLGLSLKLGLGALILFIALFYVAFNIVIVNYRAFVTETSARKALMEKKEALVVLWLYFPVQVALRCLPFAALHRGVSIHSGWLLCFCCSLFSSSFVLHQGQSH